MMGRTEPGGIHNGGECAGTVSGRVLVGVLSVVLRDEPGRDWGVGPGGSLRARGTLESGWSGRGGSGAGDQGSRDAVDHACGLLAAAGLEV